MEEKIVKELEIIEGHYQNMSLQELTRFTEGGLSACELKGYHQACLHCVGIIRARIDLYKQKKIEKTGVNKALKI